jgi:FMN phosphatase YigB (HAD superfamily)
LLVDFRKDPPEVISTAEELKKLGFITDTKKYSMDDLGIYDFFDDIIKIYKNRYGKTKIFK